LRALAGPKKAAEARWRLARWLLTPILCALSFFVAWIYFYAIGQMILAAFPAPVVTH
jgi:hypothetical protein